VTKANISLAPVQIDMTIKQDNSDAKIIAEKDAMIDDLKKKVEKFDADLASQRHERN
jgi:hypothetical protein